MGNEPPKKQKLLSKQQIEIITIKVKSHLELQRDRRQNEANGKEKALIKMINMPTRSKQDEVQKASSIITDLNFVRACNIIVRFSDILKDRSMHLAECRGKPDNIQELMPYIESIIWSTKPLNLAILSEFNSAMGDYFGQKIYDDVKKSEKVDKELKECFKDLLPKPEDINTYFIQFSNRTGMTLQQINMAGHEFNSSFQGGDNAPGGGNGGGGMQIPDNYAQVNQPVNIQQPMQNPQMFQPPQQFQTNQQQPYMPYWQQVPIQNFQQVGMMGGQGVYQQQQPMMGQMQPMQMPQQGFQQPMQQPQQGFQQQTMQNQMQPQTMPQQNFPQNTVQQQPIQQNTNMNQNPTSGGGYPDFKMDLPNNDQIMNKIGGGANPGAGNSKPQNNLNSLDDFEERMKNLRNGL